MKVADVVRARLDIDVTMADAAAEAQTRMFGADNE
jgi:hypothetical protein